MTGLFNRSRFRISILGAFLSAGLTFIGCVSDDGYDEEFNRKMFTRFSEQIQYASDTEGRLHIAVIREHVFWREEDTKAEASQLSSLESRRRVFETVLLSPGSDGKYRSQGLQTVYGGGGKIFHPVDNGPLYVQASDNERSFLYRRDGEDWKLDWIFMMPRSRGFGYGAIPLTFQAGVLPQFITLTYPAGLEVHRKSGTIRVDSTSDLAQSYQNLLFWSRKDTTEIYARRNNTLLRFRILGQDSLDQTSWTRPGPKGYFGVDSGYFRGERAILIRIGDSTSAWSSATDSLYAFLPFKDPLLPAWAGIADSLPPPPAGDNNNEPKKRHCYAVGKPSGLSGTGMPGIELRDLCNDTQQNLVLPASPLPGAQAFLQGSEVIDASDSGFKAILIVDWKPPSLSSRYSWEKGYYGTECPFDFPVTVYYVERKRDGSGFDFREVATDPDETEALRARFGL